VLKIEFSPLIKTLCPMRHALFPAEAATHQDKAKKAISEWKLLNAGVKKLGTPAKQSAHRRL